MLKLVSGAMTAILIGCLAVPADAFAARIDPEPQESRHSSALGTAVFARDGNGVVFTFRSVDGRRMRITGDRRTGIWAIEGLLFQAVQHGIAVSYNGQVVHAVLGSDGTFSDIAIAEVTDLIAAWREASGIGPDLALAAQVAIQEMRLQNSGLRIRPQAVLDCRGAEQQVAQDLVGVLAGCASVWPICGLSIIVLAIDTTTMVMECGWGYECDSCGIG